VAIAVSADEGDGLNLASSLVLCILLLVSYSWAQLLRLCWQHVANRERNVMGMKQAYS